MVMVLHNLLMRLLLKPEQRKINNEKHPERSLPIKQWKSRSTNVTYSSTLDGQNNIKIHIAE